MDLEAQGHDTTFIMGHALLKKAVLQPKQFQKNSFSIVHIPADKPFKFSRVFHFQVSTTMSVQLQLSFSQIVMSQRRENLNYLSDGIWTQSKRFF